MNDKEYAAGMERYASALEGLIRDKNELIAEARRTLPLTAENTQFICDMIKDAGDMEIQRLKLLAPVRRVDCPYMYFWNMGAMSGPGSRPS